MSATWVKLSAALVAPPGINILLLGIGFIYWMRAKRVTAFMIMLVATALLYGFSIDCVSSRLLHKLEAKVAVKPLTELANQESGAIVMLAAGKPAFSADSQAAIGGDNLLRLKSAVQLFQETKLPIVISGGVQVTVEQTEADIIAKSLIDDFKVENATVWLENESTTTLEQAKNVKKLLEKNDINRVIVVAHAWHMPRIIQTFKRYKIKAEPFAVGYTQVAKKTTFRSLIPKASNLQQSAVFMHEYVGSCWYGLLEFFGKIS